MTEILLFAGSPGQKQKLAKIGAESVSVQYGNGVLHWRMTAVLTDAGMQAIRRASQPIEDRRIAAIRITAYDTCRIIFDGDVVFSPGRIVEFHISHEYRPAELFSMNRQAGGGRQTGELA